MLTLEHPLSPHDLTRVAPIIASISANFARQNWREVRQRVARQLDDEEIEESEFAIVTLEILGFIDLKPTIALTPAGERLLNGKRTHETLTRQLMKFQLPSPYHTADASGPFGVKPYLELLRLTHELDGISKREIAMFFLQLTRVSKYDEVKQKITDFRAASKAHKGNRRAFADDYFDGQIAEIFADQIEKKDFVTRQSSETTYKNFLRTKKSSMRDYADAFMRYVRATQLATFDARSTRLRISQFKKAEVEFLLQTVERTTRIFGDTAQFKDYLFDADNIALYTDDEQRLKQSIQAIETQNVSAEKSDVGTTQRYSGSVARSIKSAQVGRD